jgi:nucleotide-binding universal stress UspA family protein
MRVLVTLDQSALSQGAIAAVADWARESGARVSLLHVIHPREAVATGVSGGLGRILPPLVSPSGHYVRAGTRLSRDAENRSQAIDRARQECGLFLRSVVAEHLPDTTVDIFVDIAEDIAGTILNRAAEIDADFIAMSTHGRTPVGNILFGSVTEQVVRESRIPVLVIGPGVRARQTMAARPERGTVHRVSSGIGSPS